MNCEACNDDALFALPHPQEPLDLGWCGRRECARVILINLSRLL